MEQYILQIVIKNEELGIERMPCRPMSFESEADAKAYLSKLKDKYQILEAKLVYVEEIKIKL